MEKVSIIIPVIRPQNVDRLKQLIAENAGYHEYVVLFEEDKKRIGAPKMVKKLTDKADTDLVMYLGDDCEPKPNFLKNAVEAMANLPDGWGLVGLVDIQRPGEHAPAHWLAHKKMLEHTGGEFFHTGYIHQYCDNELFLWALCLGRYILCKTSVIDHKHVGFSDKTKPFMQNISEGKDSDMKRVYSQEAQDHDKNLFLKRKEMILEKTGQAKPSFTGERVVIGDMKKYIPTLQEHIARYNFALGPALNKKVLDAACGTGYGSKLLSEAATEVTGADVCPETIKYASRLYPDIKFRTVDLNKEFPAGDFDLCVSFETIEHLKKPEVFLKNVAKNCRQFLFSIPINNPSKYHLQVWSREEIIEMMQKYWARIEWFNQKGFYIYGGNQDAVFLIGYATSF